MLKKILMAIGIAKAPTPVGKFVSAKAMFGTLPALAILGWKYRSQIKSLVQRQGHASPAMSA